MRHHCSGPRATGDRSTARVLSPALSPPLAAVRQRRRQRRVPLRYALLRYGTPDGRGQGGPARFLWAAARRSPHPARAGSLFLPAARCVAARRSAQSTDASSAHRTKVDCEVNVRGAWASFLGAVEQARCRFRAACPVPDRHRERNRPACPGADRHREPAATPSASRLGSLCSHNVRPRDSLRSGRRRTEVYFE